MGNKKEGNCTKKGKKIRQLKKQALHMNITRRAKKPRFLNNEEDISEECSTKQSISLMQTNSENCEFQEEKKENHVFIPQGRRIVDISFFMEKIFEFANHGQNLGCLVSGIKVISEKRSGLHSHLKLICSMCNLSYNLPTTNRSDTEKLDVNRSAVAGAMAIGCGFSQLEELVSMLDLPCFTETTYSKIHMDLVLKWEEVAVQSMAEAAAREREAAIMEGRFSPDGTPVIDVIADGCWCKRSYKTKYSALSGAAAIIGRKFGEVLFFGVRNKYCSYCSWYENLKKIDVPSHVCFKNYQGASTGMESDILLEGFKKSEELYGLIFGRLIADGDASTYAKIVQARPYKNVSVEKIECRNHLMRNMCTKIKALSSDKRYPIKLRRHITQEAILRMRRVVKKSVEWINSQEIPVPQKTLILHNNIMNANRHAFGDHEKCEDYYCCSDKSEQGKINDFKGTILWLQISMYLSSLAAHARSLISDVDSNKVEQFNSIIAKVVGGKRVNYANRGSYQGRCNAAVVSHNSRTPLTTLSKSILGHTPKSKIKKLEQRRIQKRLRKKSSGPTLRKRVLFPTTKDINYGCAEKPDIPNEVFDRLKDSFLDELRTQAKNRNIIERSTVYQSESSEWMEIRRKLLTASNFGKVCKRRPQTTCSTLVKAIVAPKNLSAVTAVAHGRKFEKIAIQQLSEQEKITIEPCGIFIDEDIPFLGATPDGMAGEIIVEIKCPFTAFKMGFETAVKEKKITFWNTENGLIKSINKNHDWYFQIQGQLHITQKSQCLFGLWYGHDKKLVVEYIPKDDIFWQLNMVEKLQTFYINCLLPEILDSRLARKMSLRACTTLLLQQRPKCKAIRKIRRTEASQSNSSKKEDSVDVLTNHPDENSENCSGVINSEYVFSFQEL